MAVSMLLVHSPLVGPMVWAALAKRAEARGHDAVVPNLASLGDAERPRWETLVADAVGAAEGLQPPIVVIGHSGAGVFMPEIGHRLGGRRGPLLFVDAVVPPRHGAHRTSPAMRHLLDEQTTDGLLRRWLDWWPPEVIADLLPNPADRVALAADMPILPRAFYEEPVPVPDQWSDWPCGYVKLSAAYDVDDDEAGNRGWPHSSIDGTHLSIYTQPDVVLETIEALLAQITHSAQ